jgi:hypothetical protein
LLSLLQFYILPELVGPKLLLLSDPLDLFDLSVLEFLGLSYSLNLEGSGVLEFSLEGDPSGEVQFVGKSGLDWCVPAVVEGHDLTTKFY